MTETRLRRAQHAIVSLHRRELLVPAVALAVTSVSVYALVAVASAFPETALASAGFGQCSALDADFGCGHGFGCACHLLPEPGSVI